MQEVPLPQWAIYLITAGILSFVVAFWMWSVRWSIRRKVDKKPYMIDMWKPTGRKIILTSAEAMPQEGTYQFEFESKNYTLRSKYLVPGWYPPVGVMSHFGCNVQTAVFEEGIPDDIMYRCADNYDPNNTADVVAAKSGQKLLEIIAKYSQEIDKLKEQIAKSQNTVMLIMGIGTICCIIGFGIYCYYQFSNVGKLLLEIAAKVQVR